MLKPTVVSVSQLNKYVKSLMESDRVLQGLMVRGEISNFLCHHKSGHLYFTLKDGEASIKAVMFRGYASALPFLPENGMSVIVSGSVSLYERDGNYQLYATDMQPDGVGALHVAYEQLKEKLAREGLFDERRKRPLPRFPERIGIVTSEGAAALQDLLNILSRRYPVATVVLYPAKVQGAGAAKTIAAGIRALNARGDCDLLIIGRGGGSIEDLWAFNEEALARTIASSKIPVVSAVGHETDFTIADFVADLRAPTPSAAAELTTPNLADLRYYLADLEERCREGALGRLSTCQARLREIEARLATPESVLRQQAQQLEFLRRTVQDRVLTKLAQTQSRMKHLADLAGERSPLQVLSRGYTLTYADGKPLVSAADALFGMRMETRLSDGTVLSTVTGRKENQP